MDNIKSFRDKFNIPVTDDEIESIPYVRPAEDSPEIQYLKKTRESLGGPIPRRRNTSKILPLPNESAFVKLYEGTGERKISTTMAAVRVLN